MNLRCAVVCLFIGFVATQNDVSPEADVSPISAPPKSEEYIYYPNNNFNRDIHTWTLGDPELRVPDSAAEPSKLDVKIMDVVNTLKPRFSEGVPELGLPILDPLVIGDIPLEMKESFFRGDVSLANLVITGINNVEINSVHFEAKKSLIVFDISLPSVNISENFDVNGWSLFILPIKMSGKSSVVVNNINVKGAIKLGISLSGVSLKKYRFRLTLDNYQVHLDKPTRLSMINRIIDWIINKVSSSWVNSNQDNLTTILEEEIQDIGSVILSRISVTDLLG